MDLNIRVLPDFIVGIFTAAENNGLLKENYFHQTCTMVGLKNNSLGSTFISRNDAA